MTFIIGIIVGSLVGWLSCFYGVIKKISSYQDEIFNSADYKSQIKWNAGGELLERIMSPKRRQVLIDLWEGLMGLVAIILITVGGIGILEMLS